jgi:adenosine deaminase
MPKVELHVHLEGAIEPATLLKLARRHRVYLPADDEAGIRQWFQFSDFAHFIDVYLTCSKCLRDPEDFQEIAYDFMALQAEQNILYSEVHFTIGTHLFNGVNGGEVAHALEEAMTEGERRYGTRMRLIPDIVRDVGVDRADRTLEWALDGRGKGVIALGLSGFESKPNEPFREHFEVAHAEGLHVAVHAGETQGPASIRSALEICRPERLGHGVRSIEDPELVEILRDREIPLEVNVTSNLCLGVFPDAASHSFDRLRQAGVILTVNSDDPPFFNTTLSKEYLLLHDTFGYGRRDLAELSLAGLRHAFLTDEERQTLEADFDKRFAELLEENLNV